MAESVSSKGARGGLVTIVGQAIRMIVQFAGIIILARLLPPEAFGIIAMVAIFVTLSELLRDFGLSAAALQAPQLSHAQASNIFWANVILGSALATILFLATPLLELFYSEPFPPMLMASLGLVIVLNSFQAQLQIQLARNLKFITLTTTEILSQVLGLIAAVLMAIAGFGYWALVWQMIVPAFVLLVTRAWAARWVPSWPKRGTGSRSLFAHAARLGTGQLLTWVSSNADVMVIGNQWGPTQVGYYNRAFNLIAAPINRILAPLSQVAVPTITKSGANQAHRNDLLLKTQSIIAGPLLLGLTLIIFCAPLLIPALLGPDWGPVTLLFQILATGGIFKILSIIGYWGFLLGQASKAMLLYNLVSKPLIVVLVILGGAFSVEFVAVFWTIGVAVDWPISLIFLKRYTKFPASRFAINGLRILLTLAISSGSAYLALIWLEPIGLIASYVIASLLLLLLFFGLSMLTPSGRKDIRLYIQTVKLIIRRQVNP